MRSLRRHLSYANVLATLALLFAMSGGALAAKHYLISSTSQISPAVLKKLRLAGPKGARGPAGATGATGATGLQGPIGLGNTGPQGFKGTTGAKGADGLPAPTALPPGQSESGDFGARSMGGAAGESLEAGVTFPIPLHEGAKEQVEYTTISAPTEHCKGPGQAEKGFLCVYAATVNNVGTPVIGNPETSPVSAGTGRFGFAITWTATATNPGSVGTYTVSAE